MMDVPTKSAKCETPHRYENGYTEYNGQDTQLQQEVFYATSLSPSRLEVMTNVVNDVARYDDHFWPRLLAAI
eukprot:scaffold738_cov124-Cylindrotheca_fusiformis.AAC.3